MTANLTLGAIPLVLADGEAPFVLGFTSDSRRCFEIGGAEYRRGVDRFTIDWQLDALRLRAVVINVGGESYLMASVGPILNDWWPLLEQEGGNPARPLLSAGVATSAQTFTSAALSARVSIVSAGGGVEATTTVMGIERATGLTDVCLVAAHAYSLAVIKAALLVLAEYRTLVDPVPNIDVDVAGATVALTTVLDVATEAADAIAWTHSGG
jgi:hypothetical protein